MNEIRTDVWLPAVRAVPAYHIIKFKKRKKEGKQIPAYHKGGNDLIQPAASTRNVEIIFDSTMYMVRRISCVIKQSFLSLRDVYNVCPCLPYRYNINNGACLCQYKQNVTTGTLCTINRTKMTSTNSNIYQT